MISDPIGIQLVRLLERIQSVFVGSIWDIAEEGISHFSLEPRKGCNLKTPTAIHVMYQFVVGIDAHCYVPVFLEFVTQFNALFDGGVTSHATNCSAEPNKITTSCNNCYSLQY